MMRAISMVSNSSHNFQPSRAASLPAISAAPLPYSRSMVITLIMEHLVSYIVTPRQPTATPPPALGSFLRTMKESRNMMPAVMASTINVSM